MIPIIFSNSSRLDFPMPTNFRGSRGDTSDGLSRRIWIMEQRRKTKRDVALERSGFLEPLKSRGNFEVCHLV
jgi:hypothetical protein